MMEQIELVRPTWTCSACKSELPYERRTVIAHKRACINTKQQSPSSLSSEKYRLGAMESHFDHSAPSLMEKPKSLPLSTFSNSTPANNNLVFKPLDAVLSNDDIRERQRLKIAEKERKKKAMTMTISSLEDHPVKTEENPSQPPPAGFVGYSPHVRKLKLRRTDCMYGSRDILDEESTLCLRAQGLSNGFGYLMYVGDPITGEVLATIRMSFSLFFARFKIYRGEYIKGHTNTNYVTIQQQHHSQEKRVVITRQERAASSQKDSIIHIRPEGKNVGDPIDPTADFEIYYGKDLVAKIIRRLMGAPDVYGAVIQPNQDALMVMCILVAIEKIFFKHSLEEHL